MEPGRASAGSFLKGVRATCPPPAPPPPLPRPLGRSADLGPRPVQPTVRVRTPFLAGFPMSQLLCHLLGRLLAPWAPCLNQRQAPPSTLPGDCCRELLGGGPLGSLSSPSSRWLREWGGEGFPGGLMAVVLGSGWSRKLASLQA